MPRRGEKSILKYFRSEVETEKISRDAPSVYPAWGWPICLRCSTAVCDDDDALLGLVGSKVEGHPYSATTRKMRSTAGATSRRYLVIIVEERGRALDPEMSSTVSLHNGSLRQQA
jgi:hypothetical protein